MTDPFAELNAALADRYIIDQELGRGGMALVYLARDIKHERFVALKTLRPEIAMALGRERFLREIKLAARLQHPNILPVYDSGDAAGRCGEKNQAVGPVDAGLIAVVDGGGGLAVGKGAEHAPFARGDQRGRNLASPGWAIDERT